MESERLSEVREAMERYGIDRATVIESSQGCPECWEASGNLLHMCPKHELALSLASDNHSAKIGRADPLAFDD